MSKGFGGSLYLITEVALAIFRCLNGVKFNARIRSQAKPQIRYDTLNEQNFQAMVIFDAHTLLCDRCTPLPLGAGLSVSVVSVWTVNLLQAVLCFGPSELPSEDKNNQQSRCRWPVAGSNPIFWRFSERERKKLYTNQDTISTIPECLVFANFCVTTLFRLWWILKMSVADC